MLYFFFLVLPKKGPLITGGKLRYSLGDNVDVNCTSANSKPAAEINWFINGEPVSTKYLLLCNSGCGVSHFTVVTFLLYMGQKVSSWDVVEVISHSLFVIINIDITGKKLRIGTKNTSKNMN